MISPTYERYAQKCIHTIPTGTSKMDEGVRMLFKRRRASMVKAKRRRASRVDAKRRRASRVVEKRRRRASRGINRK